MNPDGDHLESEVVAPYARPPRFAALIPKQLPNWQQIVAQAMREHYKVWGAWSTILIPVDDGISLASQETLRAFDPDYIFAFPGGSPIPEKNALKQIARFSNPFIHEDSLLSPLPSPMYPYMSVLDAIPDYAPGQLGDPSIECWQYELGSLNYQLALTASVGLFEETILTALRTRGYSPIIRDGFDAYEGLRSALSDNLFPLSSNPAAFSTYGAKPFYRWSHLKQRITHVVVGKSLEDFCLFNNLLKMRFACYWLPFEKDLSELNGVDHIFGEVFANLVRAQGRYQPKSICLLSSEDRKIDIENIVRVLIERHSIKGQIDRGLFMQPAWRSIRQKYKLFFACAKSFDERVVLAKNRHPMMPIQTPIPFEFEDKDATRVRWISEINYSGKCFAPSRRLVDTMVRPSMMRATSRISKSGLAYECPNELIYQASVPLSTWNPSPLIIDDETSLIEYASERGQRIELSDKGRYHRQMVSMLGGISGLSDLLTQNGCTEMLQKFVSEEHSKKINGENSCEFHDLIVSVNGRRYFRFEAFARFGDDLTKHIDRFCSIGLLERGYCLRCPLCGSSGWYPLTEVNLTFKCIRCRNLQQLTVESWKQPVAQPYWYYALNEVAYQFMRNNGDVPALALASLIRDLKGSCCYLPECNVFGDKQIEVDFLLFNNGELYLGEGKRAGELSVSQGEDLFSLAKSLDASYLILATSQTLWKEPIKARMNALVAETNLEVIYMPS